MSLIRNRYEQAVRFSWLARQSDHQELVKFLGSYYAKANQVFRSLTPAQRTEFAKTGAELHDWMDSDPTKEQRAFLKRWEALSLESMASKRDALPPLADTRLDRATLADLYTPIYRQFSSVAHFDAYAARMLALHRAPSGELVLAPDPWWPATLAMYDALLSLIQCNEALLAFEEAPKTIIFSSLYERWCVAARKMTAD
jgi:hypothetical protein